MSKNSFFKKIDHAKEKISIGLEKLGLGKQIGFRKERPPREVLQHWEATRRSRILDQVNLKDIYNSYDPSKGTPWMCLVHMARDLSVKHKDSAERIKVLKTNFENQIRTWDIVSTSLLSNKVFERDKKNAIIGVIGYVLNVPPQNIVATNETDAWVENHIGREGSSPSGKISNAFELAKHIQERSNVPQKGFTHTSNHINALNKKVAAPRLRTSNYLLTPDELSAKTINYNEVLVIGRPGVNIHGGMLPTAEIKVSAIFLIKKYIPDHLCLEYVQLAKAMSAANNNVPIFYINNVIENTIDEYDYLASAEGIKTIKYVYDHFLSKPYTMVNLPGCPASNWDVFLDTPGRRVHRPNHGLAHTLRVANAVKVIADMYNSRLPKGSQIPAIIIHQQQLFALFSVIGRLNDVGFQESEEYQKKMGLPTSMYDEFHKVALAGKQKYLKKGPLYLFNSPQAKAITKLPLSQQVKYEKLGNEIYRAAHNIDLMRCYEKSKFHNIIYQPAPHDGVKSLNQMIGPFFTDLMLKYHRDVIKATGDRCMGFDPRANYNLKLFGQCSQDFNYCLQQINNVDKYTYDEVTCSF